MKKLNKNYSLCVLNFFDENLSVEAVNIARLLAGQGDEDSKSFINFLDKTNGVITFIRHEDGNTVSVYPISHNFENKNLLAELIIGNNDGQT